MVVHSALPQELIDAIIDNIFDKPTLRACTLVCRSWLFASRHNLYTKLVLRGEDLDDFLHHLDNDVFRPSLRRLDLFFCENGPTQRLFRHLPDFPRLTELRIDSTMYYFDFPPLPNLKRLELSRVNFGSFSHFTVMLASLPKLKHLALESIEWAAARGWAAVEDADDDVPRPRLQLDTLNLNITARPISEVYFFDWLNDKTTAPQTAHLILNLSVARISFATSQPILLNGYFHNCGAGITSLSLCFDVLFQTLTGHAFDLSLMPNLETLHITFDGDRFVSSWKAFLRVILPTLLEQLPTNSPLAHLSLGLLTHHSLFVQLPPPDLQRFAACLDSAQLGRLRMLQFTVLCGGHHADQHGQPAANHYDPAEGWDAALMEREEMCPAERVFRRQILQHLRMTGSAKVRCVMRLQPDTSP
ncbi:hypothetical protein MIND_01287000 [Mycena indigotica]|uniref:F-box domain-containing protein n=1 Tax=Mycena indigotica TaxID=2126181 RepID=A0A8H6VVA7_9AGAR|nr:uncharacterized protein MIND_01287000 [Mycena indigotica]KAF7291423.1 hypothetical protein MIND_01287000 [Mycena indigotica]